MNNIHQKIVECGQFIERVENDKKMLNSTMLTLFNELANQIFKKENSNSFELKRPLICKYDNNEILVWKIACEIADLNYLVSSNDVDAKFDDMVLRFERLNANDKWQLVKQLARTLKIYF